MTELTNHQSDLQKLNTSKTFFPGPIGGGPVRWWGGGGGKREGGGRESHMTMRKIPIVSLRGRNCRFWFHLGCWNGRPIYMYLSLLLAPCGHTKGGTADISSCNAF